MRRFRKRKKDECEKKEMICTLSRMSDGDEWVTWEMNVIEICTQAFMKWSSWGAKKKNPSRLNGRKDGRGSTGGETCLLRDHSRRGGGGRTLLSPSSLLLLHWVRLSQLIHLTQCVWRKHREGRATVTRLWSAAQKLQNPSAFLSLCFSRDALTS